jgi:uncharacterized protein (UPF0332 family)
VTPEAKDYLEKARDDLDDGLKIARIPLAKVAARSAYYAAFHAAEAFIIERTGEVAKTHTGVRAEFARLLKDTLVTERQLLTFLAVMPIFLPCTGRFGAVIRPPTSISLGGLP